MEATTTSEALVIDFDAKGLPPVAFFKAKGDIRYYLEGVYVQPHPTAPGCVLIATDGHRAAMFYDPNGKASRPAILNVSRELVSAASKKPAKHTVFGNRRIVMEAGRLVMKEVGDHHETELFIQAGKSEIEGKYPDVWGVLPKPDDLVPGLLGAMRAAYAADLGAVAKLLRQPGNKRFNALDHYTKGSDGCCVILTRFQENPNFIVITMHVRADEFPRKEPLPAIFNRATAAAGA